MIREKRVAALARASLVLLLVLGTGTRNTGAGQIVSGSYIIKESTDLGTQVRVTLQIHFTNASDQRLVITEMGLQSRLRPARLSEEPGAVILEPHLGTEVTRRFTIGKDDFEFLRQNTRPRLALRIQGAGAAESTAMIELMRRPG